ncbi:uncharacterized protein LOC132756396 [Ruditapes philippinarum]|uniref:uncharacterized protein LOC132756396 n=1 Tax=Ruditapes philippinarum TaxID=129788 RepID=UPI00295C38C7|nr:uncharacterized protein LOC132756396 [Ruditapes philippinarum]
MYFALSILLLYGFFYSYIFLCWRCTDINGLHLLIVCEPFLCCRSNIYAHIFLFIWLVPKSIFYRLQVGFVAAVVVDDGVTVVTRAARVNSSVSGRGLYKKLETHVLNESKIKVHAFTTGDDNPITEKQSFKSVNQLLITKPIVRFVFDKCDLQTLETETENLIVPTDEELTAFLSNDVIRQYFFRKDRIVVDLVPYRAIPANVPFLKAPNRMEIVSDVKISEVTKAKGLLTICTTYASQVPPFVCNLDVFGTDISSLKSHVVYHLRHIRKETIGSVCLLLYVDEVFDMTELDNVFQCIGLQRNDLIYSCPERVCTKLYLYEKHLA